MTNTNVFLSQNFPTELIRRHDVYLISKRDLPSPLVAVCDINSFSTPYCSYATRRVLVANSLNYFPCCFAMLNRDNPLIALLLICASLVTHKAWAANESDSTSPVITSLHVAKSPTFFGRELFPDECLTDEQCGRNSRCHLRTCSCNYGFIKAERYGQQKCLG